jgi:hypothetical protein
MTNSTRLISVAAVAATLTGVLLGCDGTGAAGGSTSSADTDTANNDALRGARRRAGSATPAPPTSSAAGSAATPVDGAAAAATPAPAATAATAATVDQIIAAAQTPDGTAIPQAAGPDGQCPPVVVAVGFWACPTLDQTCSYQAAGAPRNCVCTRTQGEGQSPTWVCE